MIPSWYPTPENPVVGGFFQQQAALFQEQFDVKVIYGYSPYLEHKTLYGRYHRYTTLERNRNYEILLKDPIPTIRFSNGLWWMSEKSLINVIIAGYRRKLRSLINSGWKPDLLHAQCVELAGIVAARLSKEFQIPWVLTEHQVFALANYSTYRQKMIRDALASVKLIAGVSQHQLRCIAIHNIDRPMIVVGNLVDETAFALSNRKERPNPFRILTVTWPGLIKDPETFFRALAKMVEKGHNDIEAIVIGKKLHSKSDTTDLEQMADKYKVKEFCQFIPSIPYCEMPKLYAEADVFVSTSVAETFGLAVREAMLTGKPVVSTASGGVDEDILPFNGIKVDLRDYQAIADAIISIKTSKFNYDPIKSREYIISKYGRQVFLDKMNLLFERAMV